MDDSIESVIEKIKLQEQDNDVKLKEKREFESKLILLKRNIREITSQISKLDQDIPQLITATNKLELEVEQVRIQRDALTLLLNDSKNELNGFRIKTENGISMVWNLRTSLCNSIKEITDKCDVQTLLLNNLKIDLYSRPMPIATKKSTVNTKKLETATELLNRAIKERDYLLREPEIGDEYIRIKNALRYSETKITSILEKK